jgi:hypothetical protein
MGLDYCKSMRCTSMISAAMPCVMATSRVLHLRLVQRFVEVVSLPVAVRHALPHSCRKVYAEFTSASVHFLASYACSCFAMPHAINSCSSVYSWACVIYSCITHS